MIRIIRDGGANRGSADQATANPRLAGLEPAIRPASGADPKTHRRDLDRLDLSRRRRDRLSIL
jgi:hypothetical protein